MGAPQGIQKRNFTTTSRKQFAFSVTDTLGAAAPFKEYIFLNQADGNVDDGINFLSISIRLSNTGANQLEYSFDGVNVHGVVDSIGFDVNFVERREYSIFLRSTLGTTFRVEAW